MRTIFKLIVVLSSVFFLTAFSCSKKKTIGEPYILYEIHGTVYGSHDVDGQRVLSPLKGIRVMSDATSEPEYTSSEGRFVVYGRSAPSSFATISFEDQDGESNHGTFMSTSQRVALRQKEPGVDRNYEGYWIASGVEVTMFLKNDDLESEPDFNLMNY